jgi:peroxiredoxin
VDAPAPPFVAQTPAGERFDLAQLRGKVVLLHFWATWCDSCRTEMPALAHVYADLHARGLELLTVSADDPHERREALDMARLHGLPAALLDAARPNGFGAPPVLPLTYVIDRGGVLRARLLPARAPLTEDGLRAVLAPLLDAAPPQSVSGQ